MRIPPADRSPYAVERSKFRGGNEYDLILEPQPHDVSTDRVVCGVREHVADLMSVDRGIREARVRRGLRIDHGRLALVT